MDECSETKLLTGKYNKANNCAFIYFVAVPHLEVIINMIKLKTVSQDQESLVVHFAIYK
jgi:hypothetical protein